MLRCLSVCCLYQSIFAILSFLSLPSRRSLLSMQCLCSHMVCCSLQFAICRDCLSSLHLPDCHVPVECRLYSIAQSSIPPTFLIHLINHVPRSVQLSILDSISTLSSLLQLHIFVYSTIMSPHPSTLCSFPYRPSVLPSIGVFLHFGPSIPHSFPLPCLSFFLLELHIELLCLSAMWLSLML